VIFDTEGNSLAAGSTSVGGPRNLARSSSLDAPGTGQSRRTGWHWQKNLFHGPDELSYKASFERSRVIFTTNGNWQAVLEVSAVSVKSRTNFDASGTCYSGRQSKHRTIVCHGWKN